MAKDQIAIFCFNVDIGKDKPFSGILYADVEKFITKMQQVLHIQEDEVWANLLVPEQISNRRGVDGSQWIVKEACTGEFAIQFCYFAIPFYIQQAAIEIVHNLEESTIDPTEM